jgi:hypothetical protein
MAISRWLCIFLLAVGSAAEVDADIEDVAEGFKQGETVWFKEAPITVHRGHVGKSGSVHAVADENGFYSIGEFTLDSSIHHSLALIRCVFCPREWAPSVASVDSVLD